jgi:hypothetical protein
MIAIFTLPLSEPIRDCPTGISTARLDVGCRKVTYQPLTSWLPNFQLFRNHFSSSGGFRCVWSAVQRERERERERESSHYLSLTESGFIDRNESGVGNGDMAVSLRLISL